MNHDHQQLSGFFAAPWWFDNELHTNTQAREHVNERVSAKQIDSSSTKIAHAGLRHAENLCHFSLRNTAGRNQYLELDHKVGPYKQVFGFAGRETQITKDVAARFSHFKFHLYLPSREMFSCRL
jgi:hypothetical protein